MKRGSRQDGMTLIEVATALLILSLGIPGSLALFRVSDERLWEAQRLTEATAAAQAGIEAFLSSPIGDLEEGFGEETLDERRRRFRVGRLRPGLWLVEVEVSSEKDRSGRGTVRFSTLRASGEAR